MAKRRKKRKSVKRKKARKSVKRKKARKSSAWEREVRKTKNGRAYLKARKALAKKYFG